MLSYLHAGARGVATCNRGRLSVNNNIILHSSDFECVLGSYILIKVDFKQVEKDGTGEQ